MFPDQGPRVTSFRARSARPGTILRYQQQRWHMGADTAALVYAVAAIGHIVLGDGLSPPDVPWEAWNSLPTNAGS